LLRLPRFRYLRPKTAREAAQMAADLGPRAMFVAGGTDLFPKLKRRQFEVETLIGLDFLPRQVHNGSAGTITVDAGVTLAAAAGDEHLNKSFAGYAEAASLVSSPPLRNAGTIGGNLCVDTRCNYYDMTYEWRKAAGFCIKKDGDICLVAPSSPRCWAVSSSDTAPMAIALDGVVNLTGPDGERELPVSALYRDDGIDYMAKQPDEIVTSLKLSANQTTSTAYVKLRRRGSIDFPIAGAAVALQLDGDTVVHCRIVLSAVASHPLEVTEAEEFLKGKRVDADTIRQTAEIAAKPAKPLDNADLSHFWRKRMVRVIVEQALEKAATRIGGPTVKLLGRNPD
jgi:4-hydroxybenzoyl-CoA reductase subunit beta